MRPKLIRALGGTDELGRRVVRPEADHARRVVLFEQEPGQSRREHPGAFELRAPSRLSAIRHGRTRVTDNVKAHVGFLHVTLDAEAIVTRVKSPVQVAQIVTGVVIAVITELNAEAMERAVVLPGQEAFHDVARFEVEPFKCSQHLGVKPLAQRLCCGRHFD